MLHYEVRKTARDSEAKPWLVLIHGLFGSLDNLNGIARSLANDVNCVLVDLPNHGLSKTIELIDYPDINQGLVNMLAELRLARAHFLGHSLGGKAAMYFALHNQAACESLIVADIAPVSYPHRHQAVFEGLQNVDLASVTSRRDALKQLSEHVKEPPTQQFLLKSLYQHEDSWQWRFRVDEIIASYPALIDWPSIDEQFTNPTLFIVGGDSDYVTPDHQATIRSLFPNVKAKVIHGTGHWLHAEKPTAFNKIVKDHIQKLSV
ncbi:alpha/beta fold hydrolase [Alteromonas sp. ASW11-36]|uniref:Alpha/beta fold hydrolase n=1 Tax=Alteromonas arenosi TaxID=3055817 RepID=A0ABT7SXJ6_9ALTE|nr:alpha/beta fold hydrolase [Alteromonas sp. ASW11-36]MDM7860919.1 alpha/beta fold hydrolase [Alteromonas sp. ASW11-36]